MHLVHAGQFLRHLVSTNSLSHHCKPREGKEETVKSPSPRSHWWGVTDPHLQSVRSNSKAQVHPWSSPQFRMLHTLSDWSLLTALASDPGFYPLCYTNLLDFCLATQHLFRRLEQRLRQEDLLHSRRPLTPVPMFINHCLGKFRIPQQGCLACKKHSAHPASAGTREQWGEDHRAWKPGGSEKRAEERLWNTKAPDSQGSGGQLLTSLHKTWAQGCWGGAVRMAPGGNQQIGECALVRSRVKGKAGFFLVCA